MTKSSEKRQQQRMRILVVLHDLGMAVFAYWFAAAIIMPLHKFSADIDVILPFAAAAGISSVLLSAFFGVFARSWRLASLLDFVALIKSALVLTGLLIIARQIGHFFYPEPFFIAEIRILFLGCILLVGFQASGRIFYRYYRFWRGARRDAARKLDATIVIGHIAEIEGALRSVEQGAIAANVVGALLLKGDPYARDIRGCKIFGSSEDLESACDLIAAGGQNVTSVLLMAGLLARPDELRIVKRVARRLGINLLRIEAVNVGGSSEMQLEEFLFRERRTIDHRPIDLFVQGKVFFITGGGGTIGGDIALRAAAHGARKIVLLDQSELGLQTRRAQLNKEFPDCLAELLICDIRDYGRLQELIRRSSPDVMIHAAALKHVDLTEENWQEAIRTNIVGTDNVLRAAEVARVPVLVNISTDKAADPIGMLGLTKHFSEFLVAAYAKRSLGLRFSVRFGNVLGSSGSVIETFLSQISAGGPVTITHPDVKRFFMSRNEAAQLVLSVASNMNEDSRSSSLFVLEMGEQIAIRDLAIELIEWAGLVPETDIPILVTGLRPGERLEEKLTGASEILRPTGLAGIDQVDLPNIDPSRVMDLVGDLVSAVEASDRSGAVNLLHLPDQISKETVQA